MESILNIAHRGASGHAPENTLAGFRKALQMGADMVELDLHQSRDHHLIVIHDRSLRRTTGSRQIVSQMSLTALKALDAGSWYGPRYRGERIPTLEEVLELVGGRAGVNIEIKRGLRAYRGIEERLLDCLARHARADRVLVSSFDEAVLHRIRRLSRDVRLGFLFKRGRPAAIIRKALSLGALSVHGPDGEVSGALIQRAHSEGLRVYVFNIDKEKAMLDWIRKGVDGIFTNYPDRLAKVLRMRAIQT